MYRRAMRFWEFWIENHKEGSPGIVYLHGVTLSSSSSNERDLTFKSYEWFFLNRNISVVPDSYKPPLGRSNGANSDPSFDSRRTGSVVAVLVLDFINMRAAVGPGACNI
jgi:hypothetical protein